MKKRALLLLFLAVIISQAVYSQLGSIGTGLTVRPFDSDNDGIADENDTIVGNSSFVGSSTVTANVTINDSINFSRGFNNTLEVVIRDVNATLVNFSFNFSEKTLNLVNVTIERQTAANKGSLLVRGITLTAGRTKTIYVNNADTSIDRLCIKDAQIDKISEISSDCSGTNETAITCPGTAGSYECSKVEGNTRFKVAGLSHTAIIQQAASEGGGDSG